MITARVFPVALVLLVLGACDSNDVPEGQVAATLNGHEITTTLVNAEMANLGSLDPKQRQIAANQALDQILGRIAISDAARELGLDKTPAGAMQIARAEQLAQIELLRQDIRGKTPPPSADEARQFISANPAMFAKHFVTVVEQLIVPKIPQSLVREMEPIETLDGIRNLLDKNRIIYRSTMGTVDSIALAPDVAKAISEMDVGAVYITAQAGGVRVNAVRSKQTLPIGGGDSIKLATDMVFEQRVNGQISNAFDKIVTEKKSKVRYSKAYSPPANPHIDRSTSPLPGAQGSSGASDLETH